MARPLRVLLIEDNEDDAALILRALQGAGYQTVARRVETPAAMHYALQQEKWDVVLADWNLPHFSALFALEMLKSQGLDLPFIVVSGIIGEEATTSAMKAGAHDFISKSNLERLGLTIDRELREGADRGARRRAEAALAASEERLQLVARATNDAVRDWDLSTNGMWWSEGFSVLFGYLAQDVETGVESWYSRLHPADKERVIASCYAAINGGATSWSEGYRFRRADGTYAEVLDRGYIVRSVRGQALRLIGAMTSLTALWKAHAALKESEARARTVLESSLDAIIGMDERGTITDWNPSAEIMFGWSRDEMLGRAIAETIIPSAQREAHCSGLRQFTETGQGPMLNRRMETSACRRDGTEFPVELSIVPLKEGTVHRFYGFIVDISERRAAEASLRDSEERLRLAMETAHMAAWDWNVVADTVTHSHTFGPLFGLLPGAQLGNLEKFMNVVHPEDRERIRQGIALSLETEAAFTREYRTVWPDGTVHWLSSRGHTMHSDEDGTPVRMIGIVTDITERKQAEVTLKSTEDQLRQAQKMEAVGQLAGGVAHDFNNLLTVITGYTDLLMSNLPAGAPMLPDLEEIRNAAERAAWLTRQLLAFSRRQVLAPQVLDLNVLIGNIEKMLHRLLGEDILAKTELAPRLARIKADPGQIEQILMNLAVNARDAMPVGGHLTIETDTVLLDESYPKKSAEVPPGRYVLLTVSDTGCGIDAETQKRIFEPFFTTKEPGKGTGLGLSTVYGIVKQSNGFIWLYSEPGVGTTFKIYLPAIDEEIQTANTMPPVQQRIGVETILLVEDAASLRILTKKILELTGYTVLAAGNLTEALKLAEERNWAIHLLLTDVVMPEGSGPDVADRLKERCPELKVLYMSGYTGTAMVHQGILESGSQLFQKPYSPDALRQKVREVLDQPRREIV